MSGLPHGSAGKKGTKVPKKKAIKRRKIVDEYNRHDIIDSISEHKESNSDTLPLTDISNTTSDECYLSTPNEVSSSSLAGWNHEQYACSAPVYYLYSHSPSYYYQSCYPFNDTAGRTSNFAWPFADNYFEQLFSDLAHCILIVIVLAEVLLVLHPTAVPACLSLSSF